MQAKVFSAVTPPALEKALGDWLKANPRITITFATQSPHEVYGSQRELVGTVIVLTVFYTETDEPKAVRAY